MGDVLSNRHLSRGWGQRWGAEALSGFALPQQGASSRNPPGQGLLVLLHVPTWLPTFTPAICPSAQWTLA